MSSTRELQPSAWLSREAISLSTQLMRNLQIQQGSNLAKFLNVNPIFYNDEAIRVWVQRELNNGLPVDKTRLQALEDRFLEVMNTSGTSYSFSTFI